MNANSARALFADALYQVLDNRVFRILVIVALLFVAFTFLVGFKEDEVVLLFGWRSFSNQGFVDFLADASGAGAMPIDVEQLEVQKLVVQTIQDLIVGGLAGTVGMMLAIAATAFFVPRMLEKGAADTLYSKPVSRLALYLSRYVSGLLFVSLLAVFLIGGMHLGFTVVSGYSDPGFLWSIVTMTYVFALLHGVTMLVGVLTRSTVASILVTMLFFMGNGCVHQIWTWREFAAWESDRREFVSEVEEEEAAVDDDDAEEDSTGDVVLRWFVRILDTLHYTLPKTGDAQYISAMLRDAIEGIGPEFADMDTGLTVAELDADYVADDDPAGVDGAWPAALDPQPGEVLFSATREDDASRWVVYRRDKREVTRSNGRTRSEWPRDAGELLEEALDTDPAHVLVSEDLTSSVASRTTRELVWTSPDGETRYQAFLFEGPPDWIYSILFVTDTSEEAVADVLDALDEVAFEIAEHEQNPAIWYQQQFSWTADKLRYNAWFSIGTSVLFGLAMLLLGWWRLSRIDF